MRLTVIMVSKTVYLPLFLEYPPPPSRAHHASQKWPMPKSFLVFFTERKTSRGMIFIFILLAKTSLPMIFSKMPHASINYSKPPYSNPQKNISGNTSDLKPGLQEKRGFIDDKNNLSKMVQKKTDMGIEAPPLQHYQPHHHRQVSQGKDSQPPQ